MKKKNKEEEKNFLEKYKTDKKFKAKVQLIGYGIIIVFIIIYANISSMIVPKNTNLTLKKDGNNNNTIVKKESLLKKISNNYEYEINVTYKDDKKTTYIGKRFKNNTEITKKENEETKNYYKIDTKYYTKNNDTFELIKENDVYPGIDKEYIELEYIKEYIEKSSLDHRTEYSNGKKEEAYHLKIKDIIKSYPELDEIEIKVIEDNEILRIEVNYKQLLEASQNEIRDCKIDYTYKNIDKVEEFNIIEEGNNNE